jgi:type IV fimbrial biogenesis protein FimT
MKKPIFPRSPGFTMFELVVTMAVVAILASLAIPSYKYITSANRVSSEVNALLGDMRYARTEAVRQGIPVTVCAANSTQTACTPGDTTWESGWIVFADPNGNRTPVSAAAILRSQLPFTTAYNSTDTFGADNSMWGVTFNREGFGTPFATTSATAVTVTVTMELHTTPANSNWTRCLVVSPLGVVSIQRVGTTLVGANCA